MEDVEIVLSQNWMRRKYQEELFTRMEAQRAADRAWLRLNHLTITTQVLNFFVTMATLFMLFAGVIMPTIAGCAMVTSLSAVTRFLSDKREEYR